MFGQSLDKKTCKNNNISSFLTRRFFLQKNYYALNKGCHKILNHPVGGYNYGNG